MIPFFCSVHSMTQIDTDCSPHFDLGVLLILHRFFPKGAVKIKGFPTCIQNTCMLVHCPVLIVAFYLYHKSLKREMLAQLLWKEHAKGWSFLKAFLGMALAMLFRHSPWLHQRATEGMVTFQIDFDTIEDAPANWWYSLLVIHLAMIWIVIIPQPRS